MTAPWLTVYGNWVRVRVNWAQLEEQMRRDHETIMTEDVCLWLFHEKKNAVIDSTYLITIFMSYSNVYSLYIYYFAVFISNLLLSNPQL